MFKSSSGRLISIDFLRVLFCTGVVIGHAYCIFFRNQYVELYQKEFTDIHIMCVDAFFMISGIMMAMYFEKHKKEELHEVFLQYHLHRYVRFLFPLLFMYMIGIVMFACMGHFFSITSILKNSSVLLMLSHTNSFGNSFEVPSWYIDSLFWMGVFVSFFLCFFKKKSLIFVFPICIYLCLSYIHAKFRNLNLGGNPYIQGFFSAGNLRALVGLSFGIELFHISNRLKNKNVNLNLKMPLIILIECLCILGLIFTFTRPPLKETEFLIYPCIGLLLFLFLQKKECLFSVVNLKPVAKFISLLSSISFMVYLSHVPLFFLIRHFFQKMIQQQNVITNNIHTYIILICIAYLYGMGLYSLEKILECSLKRYCKITV